MSRRTERQHAIMLVFMQSFHAADDPCTQKELYLQEREIKEADTVFMLALYDGVFANLPEIDEYIKKYLSGWTFERLNRPDLAILRVAVYELLHCDTPEAVIINEAVELAKKYCDDESVGFINGLLSSVQMDKNNNSLK